MWGEGGDLPTDLWAKIAVIGGEGGGGEGTGGAEDRGGKVDPKPTIP